MVGEKKLSDYICYTYKSWFTCQDAFDDITYCGDEDKND